MKLLEPLRRQRDKLCKDLIEEAESERERKAIRALIVTPGSSLHFYNEFHGYLKCPECHRPLHTGLNGWHSEKHQRLYELCQELEKAESAELKERMA